MSTTEKLLDAAEYRMRRGGYNAVSFRDLASDTNIKSSSVHYHFPKKEDLGMALVERYSNRFFDALNLQTEKSKTTKDKLKAFQAVYRAALVQDDAICLCGLLGAEMVGLPDILSEGVQEFFKSNIKWLEQALPESMSKKNKHIMAGTIVANHQGAMMLASSMGDPDIFDTLTDKMIKIALSE